MRVYIASKYIDHKKINNQIYGELKNASIDAFLPESINIDALTKEEMYAVSEICYAEITKCDVILAVCPFGKSVSSELGYAIALKRTLPESKVIIALNMDFEHEAMLYPYVDKNVNSISQLIEYLTQLNGSTLMIPQQTSPTGTI